MPHIAQLNIAETLAAVDDPLMQEFTENLDRINALAESSPGFIWRLKDDSGNATEVEAFDDPSIIVNMSVWKDVESLKDFVFNTQHLYFLKHKAKWFNKFKQASHVMWWIGEGHIPTIEEAKAKLEYLQKHGESQQAFGFKSKFEPPANL